MIKYDPNLVESMSKRLDLRDPNRRALHAVAEHLVDDDGQELICDLATGVGKTYLAAGILEYLAESGVRNVLMIVPLDVIYEKTIANFTRGTNKYIPGAGWDPVVVTAENFKQHADAMRDPNQLKLYIFKVQTLLEPTKDMRKKVHSPNEITGGPLYAHLQSLGDLVVIADEHHVYSGDADEYRRTIAELGARAVIGLTATPDAADVAAGKIIFRYTLAEAIADGLVKIPVIVYRGDGQADTRSRLADAAHLRDMKESAWRAYARSESKTELAPVLFVVCEKVAQARQIAEALAEFLPGDGKILEVTGNSSEKALRELKAVEDPSSPVRAVVSVDKLKEGWDVRNIGVIVSFRPLLSGTLTEQVLGRGLRLPFGKRTNKEAVDTVDIVAHDSYRVLLANKRALLEQVLADRAGSARDMTPTPTVTISENGDTIVTPAPQTPEQGSLSILWDKDHETSEDPSLLLVFKEYDEAVAAIEQSAQATTKIVELTPGASRIKFPRLEKEAIPQKFSLTLVTEQQARDLGRKYLSDPSIYMTRVALEAERGLDGEVIVTEKTLAEERAYVETVPASSVQMQLESKIMGLPMVEATLDEHLAAQQVVGWFLEGAGVTTGEHAEWSVKRTGLATRALAVVIVNAYDVRVLTPTWKFNVIDVPPLRIPPMTMPEPVFSKWDDFVKGQWYSGWERNIEPIASFDASTTEFRLSRLIEGASSHVEWWVRLYTNGPGWIEWSGGRYFADFIVLDKRGECWLVEGKADDDANDADVLAKKAAADAWVDEVNEVGVYGTWHYLFATETQIKNANNRWLDLIKGAK
jgi:type III restriction enzyme